MQTGFRSLLIDDSKQFEKLHDLDAVADTIGGPTAARALKALKPGGVFGTVLAPPADAAQHKVRVAAMQSAPDASRLYEFADEVARGEFTIRLQTHFRSTRSRKLTAKPKTIPAGRSF